MTMRSQTEIGPRPDLATPTAMADAAASLVPPDIAARLLPEQVKQLDRLLGSCRTIHALDYRVSSSLFGRPFYLAVIAGNERRPVRRLVADGQRRGFLAVLAELGTIALAASIIILSMAALFAGVLYGFHRLTDGVW
jgi:hypothetical protein